MLNSKEKLIVQGVSHDRLKFHDNFEEQNIVLADFDKLDFSRGPFDYALYDMNYNEGKEANPFDKIAKYYGRNQNIFLFISLLRDKKKSEEIINIINKKCDIQTKEKFLKRLNIYLDRISSGERDAKEFLNDDVIAFFNGYHVACPGRDRNIHENLNINITKPGQILNPSSFFNETSKRIEEEKSEVKRAKVYNNGNRVVTIKKNEKQQRNYSFTKLAVCDIEIKWNAKAESGKDFDCTVVLNVNSGQITVGETTIDDKNAEVKEILELCKQNDAVLINGKALHLVLEDSCKNAM